MALNKPVTTEFGVEAEYHKIVSIRDNRSVPEATVFVNVYKDAASSDLKPLMQKTFVFNNDPTEISEGEWEILQPYFLNLDAFDEAGDNHIKLGYLALKELSFYEGAIDV